MKRWTVVLLLATALAVAACGNDGSRSDLIATATDGPQITTTPLPPTPTALPTFAVPPTLAPAPTPAPVTPRCGAVDKTILRDYLGEETAMPLARRLPTSKPRAVNAGFPYV